MQYHYDRILSFHSALVMHGSSNTDVETCLLIKRESCTGTALYKSTCVPVSRLPSVISNVLPPQPHYFKDTAFTSPHEEHIGMGCLFQHK